MPGKGMTFGRGLLGVMLLTATQIGCQEKDATNHGGTANHGGTVGHGADSASGMAGHHMGGMDSSGGAMNHDAMMAYSDQNFLDMMTEHHQMAVHMAEMAQTRAESNEVKQMAAGMIQAQKAEIAQMKGWRASWFADAPPPKPLSSHMMAMMGMAGDMNVLMSAKPFDPAFLQDMIPHHAGAITMSAEAVVKSKRPEIQQLARQIIRDQAKEIGQMQARLDAASPK